MNELRQAAERLRKGDYKNHPNGSLQELGDQAVIIDHAINTIFSPDGELAQAKRKIEALVEAVDLFLEDYPLHECNRPTCAVEMARAAKELP